MAAVRNRMLVINTETEFWHSFMVGQTIDKQHIQRPYTFYVIHNISALYVWSTINHAHECFLGYSGFHRLPWFAQTNWLTALHDGVAGIVLPRSTISFNASRIALPTTALPGRTSKWALAGCRRSRGLLRSWSVTGGRQRSAALSLKVSPFQIWVPDLFTMN